jgi:hypothetical protein
MAMLALLAVAGVVHAEDPSASPAAAGAPAGLSEPGQLLGAFALLLLFGAFVLVGIVAYLMNEQRLYFGAVRGLARRGLTSRPVEVSATLPDRADAAGEAAALSVSGPASVSVGKPAKYTATSGADPAAAPTWTIEPADIAVVAPSTGVDVQVVAVKVGSFKLSAKGSGGETVTLTIAAEDGVGNGATQLPFVGAGWGSIVVALVIAVLVAALGLVRILDGQAIAGLYGTLAGYLFGVFTTSGGATSGATGGTGSTANSGGGSGGTQET